MRKAILAILTLCLFWGLALPAYATGEIDPDVTTQGQQEETQVQEPKEPTQKGQQPKDQQEPQDFPVVVSTLEELQAAVDAAEEGDSIYLDCTINMEDGDILITDKHITLRRSEGLMKTGGRMIELYGSGTISGFTFYEDCPISCSVIYTKSKGSGEIVIENCVFDVHKETNVSPYIMIDADDTAKISGCTFYCGSGYVIYSQRDTNVFVDSCVFLKGNYYAWLMIASYGEMTIENCTFEAGTGYITASLDGNIKISNCQMNTNYFKKRVYPNVYLEAKISGAGIISILDEPIEGEGFYDLFTGEKVELPITELDDLSVLAYMTDEQAAEYFAVENHIGWFDVKADERNGHFDEDEDDLDTIDPEQPTNPDVDNPNNTDAPTNNPDNGDQEPTQPPEGDNNDNPDKGEQGQPQEPVQHPQDDPTEPPTEPEQPPTGEGKDNPDDNPPEAPEQPIEPPQSDLKDDLSDTPITTPDTPQQPIDNGDSEDDDYTPPVSHRPTHRPSTPVATPIKPTPTPEPEEKPKLSCGGAVIDTSRTIVLLGYGDGDPHEEDSLARAQLAAIVFRLLDENSIAQLSNPEAAFVDVPPEMWCYEYVQFIRKAGIVYGTGGGCYSPNGLVTWAQAVTVLSRFVESQEYDLQHISYDGWAMEAVQTAVAYDWIMDSADFDPDAIISRGEFVRFVNGVLAMYR